MYNETSPAVEVSAKEILNSEQLIKMIEALREHIIKRLGNDVQNLDLVLSKFKIIGTKRNEQLLRNGEVCKYVYFIAQRCLQLSVYDEVDHYRNS